jgi:hypothetical protein
MTSERDFDRLARAWLELGPEEAPDRVVAAVLQAAETTSQVRRPFGWPTWRSFPMNRLSVAAGAVAILVVVIGGGILLNRGNQSGGVGGPPVAAPTASPPSPSPAPSVVTVGSTDLKHTMPPGTYRVGAPFGLPIRFTIPSLWTVEKLAAGEYTMINGADQSGSVVIDLIDDVFADPCHSNGGPLNPPVQKDVDSIVTALSNMVDFRVSQITDIVIDGHGGKEFDLSNSLDPATATCDGGLLIPLWTVKGGDKTSTNPGATEHIAVIDVGGTPVLLGWSANAAVRPEVEQVVKSLVFD